MDQDYTQSVVPAARTKLLPSMLGFLSCPLADAMDAVRASAASIAFCLLAGVEALAEMMELPRCHDRDAGPDIAAMRDRRGYRWGTRHIARRMATTACAKRLR